MKIKLIATLTLLMIFISACRGQAPQATPEPATTTETSAPPTNTLLPTDTLVPASTDTALSAAKTPAAATGTSYANDVAPIFEASCNKCHGIEQVKEGLDLTTYDALMVGSFNGVVVIPGNATDSFLVQQIIEGEMPKRGAKLTAEQTQIIADWINQGALNN